MLSRALIRVADVSENFKRTVKIVRRPKVTTDGRGRTVWADSVETTELQLVSTQMLQQIIDSDDGSKKDRIREVAEGNDGLLAHDVENDSFEIISDDELQKILDGDLSQPTTRKVAGVIYEPLTETVNENEEFSLVSTQVLRRMLNPEEDEETPEEAPIESGFDPYNNA